MNLNLLASLVLSTTPVSADTDINNFRLESVPTAASAETANKVHTVVEPEPQEPEEESPYRRRELVAPVSQPNKLWLTEDVRMKWAQIEGTFLLPNGRF